MKMRKELEKLWDSIIDAKIAHDMSQPAWCDSAHWRDEFERHKNEALTTLDRILNQDEAEMVERVEAIIAAHCDNHYSYDDEAANATKAVLRALGLMKEGGG